MRRLAFAASLLAASSAWPQFQSSGAPPGAPPPPVEQGLLDCSLYRYGDQLDEAVAQILGRFAARLGSSAELQSASRRGTRVEVTATLQREGLIHRVLDCPQPVVRGFVAGNVAELEIGALQSAPCQRLVDSITLAQLGARIGVLHAPTRQARCGVARNIVPNLLTLGGLTTAGRSLPGENTVTLALASALAREARCESSDPPNAGVTPDYLAHLRSLPAGVECRVGRGPPLRRAALACRSLYEAGVSCSGNRLEACRPALDEVEQAVDFAASAGRPALGTTAERADLLERLLALRSLDRLDGFIAPRQSTIPSLASRQASTLTSLLDDGAVNIDAEYERSQRDTYAKVEAALVDRWLPRIRSSGGSTGSAAQAWVDRLDIAQRRELLREGYALIAAELGLGRKRLFLIDDCSREALTAGLFGGYLAPTAPGSFVDQAGNRDARMADAVVLCANTTHAFADFGLLVATLLEEAMHARQMELVMQAYLLGRSADAASCRHARLMAAANLHASDHDCPVYSEAELRRLGPWAPFQNIACYFVNLGRYPNWPHEFHAKAFAAKLGERVVGAAAR